MIKGLTAAHLFLLASFASFAPGAMGNDFPTQARVEYVLGCMSEAGEQSYDTLYACVCEVDRIASVMSFAEYTAAETLTYLYRTPGERGGVFRDAAPDARKRVKDLRALRESTKTACFVKKLAAPKTN